MKAQNVQFIAVNTFEKSTSIVCGSIICAHNTANLRSILLNRFC